jgi:hypothetical protein
MASIEIHNRIYGTNVMLATTSRISAKWKAIAEILLKVVLNTITHTLNLEELDIYKVIFYNVQVPIILNKEI